MPSARFAHAGRAAIAGAILLAGSSALATDNGTRPTERRLFDFDLAALYRSSAAPAEPAAQPQALRASSIFAAGEGLSFTSADRSRPAWPSGHILDVMPGRR